MLLTTKKTKIKKNPIENHVDALTINAIATTAVAVTNYKGTANVNIEDVTNSEKSTADTKSDTKDTVDTNAKSGNMIIGATNTFINTGSTSTGIGADPTMLKVFAEIPSTEFLETFSVNAAKRMFSGLQLAGSDVPISISAKKPHSMR